MNKFVFFTLVFFGPILSESRNIKIVSPGAGIDLTNPSNVNVQFDIDCFDNAGSSILSLDNQTIAPKASKAFGKKAKIADFSPLSSACLANNGAYISCGGSPAVACPGTANFAGAPNLCAVGLELCSLSQVMTGYISGSTGWFWISAPSNLKFTSDSCTWTVAYTLTTNDSAIIGDTCASAPSSRPTICSPSGSISDQRYYCSHAPKTEQYGALCCEKATGASHCSITITSSDPNAFLASPEFKGGAPF